MRCERCGFDRVGTAQDLCPRCAMDFLADHATEEVQTLPEGYEPLQLIGEGASGVVWLARDRALDRLVALKRLRAEMATPLGQRLVREGRIIARLRHPNILKLYGLHRSPDGLFLVMEYIDSGSLQDRLRRGPLGPEEAARLVAHAASGLACAHRANVLHRDIKPSNVLLDEDEQPILADFGLAAPLGASGDLTAEGQILGTPAYLAPELLKGAHFATAASDIYALGAVLYASLTGLPPVDGQSVPEIVAAILTHRVIPPSQRITGIPAAIEKICLRCLAQHPEERYVSADQLRIDLEDALAQRERSTIAAPAFADSKIPLSAFTLERTVVDQASSARPVEVPGLLSRAESLFNGPDGPTRIRLQVAEDYCRRAISLEPHNAQCWGMFSRLCVSYRAYGYDASDARYRAAGNAAEKAVQLDGGAFEARFALANFYRSEDPTFAEGERLLRQLHDERPDDGRVLRTLGHALRFVKRFEEALVAYAAADSLPGGDPLSLIYAAHTLSVLGRQSEADAMIDACLNGFPSGLGMLRKLFFLLRAHGDTAAARAFLPKIPLEFRRDDRGTYLSFLTGYWSREPDEALQAVSLAPSDFLEDWYFVGTTAHLAALAHRQAGRAQAARAKWESALHLLERRAESEADSPLLQLHRADVLGALGKTRAAEKCLRRAKELLNLSEPVQRFRVAMVELNLGRPDGVLQELRENFRRVNTPRYFPITRAQLRVDPEFDPLRGDVLFQQLQNSVDK